MTINGPLIAARTRLLASLFWQALASLFPPMTLPGMVTLLKRLSAFAAFAAVCSLIAVSFTVLDYAAADKLATAAFLRDGSVGMAAAVLVIWVLVAVLYTVTRRLNHPLYVPPAPYRSLLGGDDHAADWRRAHQLIAIDHEMTVTHNGASVYGDQAETGVCACTTWARTSRTAGSSPSLTELHKLHLDGLTRTALGVESPEVKELANA